jgi:cytidylate kinase
MIITIDGPTASGKSCVAKKVAQELRMYYFNSGFLYRALAYILLHYYKYDFLQLSMPKSSDLAQLFEKNQFSYLFNDVGDARMLFQDIDITAYLKDCSIDQAASIISANKEVRDYLITMQRYLIQMHDVVTDGRDMGSVIFPYADIKIYLTASLQVRAYRWCYDQAARNNIIEIEFAKLQLQERDTRDQSRAIAPLIIPENAIIIDTSEMSEQAVVAMIVNYKKTKSYIL